MYILVKQNSSIVIKQKGTLHWPVIVHHLTHGINHLVSTMFIQSWIIIQSWINPMMQFRLHVLDAFRLHVLDALLDVKTSFF